MIIDTDKLREAINHRDVKVDWERVPMKTIESLEKRAVESLNLVKQVETLAEDLKELL